MPPLRHQEEHINFTMTGIADAILYLKKPYSRDRRKRFVAHFLKPSPQTRFAVLSWKRTGSNMLCGILFNHPEVVMHNELFNPSRCYLLDISLVWHINSKLACLNKNRFLCYRGTKQLTFSPITLKLSIRKMLGLSKPLHRDGLFSPVIYFPMISWILYGLQRFLCKMNSSDQRTKQ